MQFRGVHDWCHVCTPVGGSRLKRTQLQVVHGQHKPPDLISMCRGFERVILCSTSQPTISLSTASTQLRPGRDPAAKAGRRTIVPTTGSVANW